MSLGADVSLPAPWWMNVVTFVLSLKRMQEETVDLVRSAVLSGNAELVRSRASCESLIRPWNEDTGWSSLALAVTLRENDVKMLGVVFDLIDEKHLVSVARCEALSPDVRDFAARRLIQRFVHSNRGRLRSLLRRSPAQFDAVLRPRRSAWVRLVPPGRP